MTRAAAPWILPALFTGRVLGQLAVVLDLAPFLSPMAVWMAIRPEERWTGDLIPVVFHIVLASFLLVVAGFHRERGRERACRGVRGATPLGKT
jgi:hypothetical protein